MAPKQITVPNAKLELDDLLSLIRHLDSEARRRIAQVLVEAEMDGRLGELIRQLALKPGLPDLSDEAIDFEVKATRRPRHSA